MIEIKVMREYTYSSDKEFSTKFDMNQIFDLDTLFKVTVYVKKKLNSNQTVLHTRAPKFKQFDLIYAQMKMFRGSFDFR